MGRDSKGPNENDGAGWDWETFEIPSLSDQYIGRDSLRPYRPRHIPRFLADMAERSAGQLAVQLAVEWLNHFGSVAVYPKASVSP